MLMKNNDILIIHGTDYKDMTIRLLEQAGLADLIGDRNKKIGMKPNLLRRRCLPPCSHILPMISISTMKRKKNITAGKKNI